MTTLVVAREKVYERFKTQWGTRTDFAFENEDNVGVQPDTVLARVTFRSLGGGQETLGPKLGRKYQRNASVFVDIFTPVDKGMELGDGHAVFARDIFEGEQFDGLNFNDGVVRELGDDGTHYMHQMEASCFYTETK